MKLLFDENISFRILKKLNPDYENCIHQRNIGTTLKNDFEIWNYAKENDFTIVTFDEDFYEWMLLKGFPPKIIWLRCGNTSTDSIAKILNEKSSEIKDFHSNHEVGLIELR